MPDLVEIGPEWDPAAHDYGDGNFFPSTGPGREMAMIMGLAALSSLALVGVGAFFTAAAVETGEALTVTYVTAEGTAMVFAGGTTLTAGQAVIVTTVTSGGLATEPAAVTALMSSIGFRLLSLEGLLALAAYEPPTPFWGHYGEFGNYMGNFYPNALPGGGLTTPPGFPGFPGGGHQYGKVCYMLDGVEYCHLQY